MPKVTFLPLNRVVEANIGDSLLDVALAHDIPMQHACGGFCSCTTCHVHPATEADAKALSSMDEDERERLEGVDQWTPLSRLGCQAQVRADVTVTIQCLDV